MTITADEYRSRFGRAPALDDLERVNCDRGGEIGHWCCGVCATCERPRSECAGCDVRAAFVEPDLGDVDLPTEADFRREHDYRAPRSPRGRYGRD